MHRLARIKIENYKTCRSVDFPVGDFTPLVGQNNCGKTTILKAIAWALKPGKVDNADFANPEDPIVVTARIDGISESIISKIPETKHQKAIQPYCINGTLWIRSSYTAKEKAAKQEIWDPEGHDGDGIPANWRDYPSGIPQAVKAIMPEPLFIEAMHDVGEDLGKAKAGTTIKGLLDEIMTPLLNAHEQLNSSIETIRSIISADGGSRSGHLIEFDQQASAALQNFFPGLSLELDLQVLDIKEFFKAGNLRVLDAGTGDKRPFDSLGSGAQRSIQMALIRHLSDIKAKDGQAVSRRLLLIDEPELYLHPQGARRLRSALKNLSQHGYQVIFGTHSPLMIDRDSAAGTIIVTNTSATGAEAHVPLEAAVANCLDDAPSQSRTLFELGNLAEIYFSERVVLCEGKTDKRILPLAYERLYGRTPEEDRITFISLGEGCTGIPKTISVLYSMKIKPYGIVDLDFAFVGGRQAGVLDRSGQDLVEAKNALAILARDRGWSLESNGLPSKKTAPELSAAGAWAEFARQPNAQSCIKSARESLLEAGIWAWSSGAIEEVIGDPSKGEDAIIVQEQRMRDMPAEEIRDTMPELIEAFAWIRGEQCPALPDARNRVNKPCL